jgi:arabinan endo-1,5-alpha-L-arabinosidase
MNINARFSRWMALRRNILLSVVILYLPLLSNQAVRVQSVPAQFSLQEANQLVYDNPLEIHIPGDGLVESCADPAILRGQTPDDPYWYIYCTTDPLNDEDLDSTGGFNFHLIPILRSYDLVTWEYVGDAFSARPAWVADDAGLWAPDIQYFNGQYYLYYTASWTDLPGGGSAIGVATSSSPTGPWVDSGAPVVEPHAPDCCPNDRRWVFDPSIVADETGQRWIYYGSYFGGLSVRRLSADGLISDPASQVQIAIANRYEGGYVIQREGYYYLFVSATDCCRGPLTGYSVFAGRSASPTGPFLDREGVSFLAGRVGGTPVISMNGNRWVGPGHNSIFTDFAGQDWMVYHAIDRFDPYFEGAVGFTKRPVLMDVLVWEDGWPSVRGGLWASDNPQPAPAAQPGDHRKVKTQNVREAQPGKLIPELSDEFTGSGLSAQWSWVRPPSPDAIRFTGEAFEFDTQAADLFEDSDNASVLLEEAPNFPYLVEVRLSVNLPAEGCCFNFVQGGLVVYGDDDNYIKLVEVSIWETRQTEFAKEWFPVPAGYPRYGNTVAGPPADWVYLRLAVYRRGGEEHYTPYTSMDGENWVRGGTWTHALGKDTHIGLVSMGGGGFTTTFDYIRVYHLRQVPAPAP